MTAIVSGPLHAEIRLVRKGPRPARSLPKPDRPLDQEGTRTCPNCSITAETSLLFLIKGTGKEAGPSFARGVSVLSPYAMSICVSPRFSQACVNDPYLALRPRRC